MNKLSTLVAPLALLAAWPAAQSQEVARVIASTPVIQQITVPHQVCTETPVLMQRQQSGAGAVVGALAGGVIGNQFGNGSGQAAATAIGLIGGAILGNHIGGEPAQVARNATHCAQQVTYESRVVGYTVIYEYAGRQYTTQMNRDPGPHLNIQITPTALQMQVYTTPAPPAPVVTHAPLQVRTYPPIIVAPAHRPPVYYNPRAYHTPPVYGLPTVTFRWDAGSRHGRGRGHHRRHGHHNDNYPGRWR